MFSRYEDGAIQGWGRMRNHDGDVFLKDDGFQGQDICLRMVESGGWWYPQCFSKMVGSKSWWDDNIFPWLEKFARPWCFSQRWWCTGSEKRTVESRRKGMTAPCFYWKMWSPGGGGWGGLKGILKSQLLLKMVWFRLEVKVQTNDEDMFLKNGGFRVPYFSRYKGTLWS